MKPFVPPTALVKQEVRCAPVDMELCSDIPELSDGTPAGFHTWTKAAIIDWGTCKLKQKHLVECIDAYNKAP